MATTTDKPAKVWTEAELMDLPGDGYIHEVVDGELIMSPKNNAEHGEICVRLVLALGGFVTSYKRGVVWDSSTGFWMKNQNCRAPDISFVSKERLRGLERPPRKFFEGAPDLAVEVMSPSNTPEEITARLKDYFASGTRLAWLIHPEEQYVEICRAADQRRILGSGALLDGEDVVPGFQYPIADLFKAWAWD